MKYIDSFEYSLALSTSNHSADYYSDWIDVSWANQLISEEHVVTASVSGETIDITVERNRTPITTDTAILTHGQITTSATTQDEQSGSSVGAGTTVIGARVRYHVAVAGTWTSTTAAITLKLIMKRN